MRSIIHITSRVSMTSTREDIQAELRDFMVGFACSMERVYGQGRGGALLGNPGQSAEDVEPTLAKLDDAWLWQAVLTMYEYGINGQPHDSFGKNGDIGNMYGEAEMFLLGLDSLKLFMEEDEVRWPRLSIITVKTAVARHILDGGERYITRDDDEMAGYLSFSEVALLADMDERSVRNAANPKLTDALATKNFGRRTMIHIDDARQWLAARKGFVPTKGVAPEPLPDETNWSTLNLPYPLLARIEEEAMARGIPSWELLVRKLDQADRDAP